MRILFQRKQVFWVVWLTSLGLIAGIGWLPCPAQQIHRNPFESEELSWRKTGGDVEFVEKVHRRSAKGARNGQRSEYLQIEAKQGSKILYQYPLGRAPISEELNVGLWIKANRPGIQVLARVVLPNQRDPKSLDDRLTTYIRGDSYRLVGRWQRLELNRPMVLARQQQQMMQSQLKKAINFKDAYIDRIVLNVYGGPGKTEVWIDDLEAGPIYFDRPEIAQPKKRETPGTPTTNTLEQRRAATVEFNSSQLLVSGKRYFIRGIRYTDTPLPVLRNAGINTIWFPENTSPAILREAADQGFWLVPNLGGGKNNQHLVSRNLLAQKVSRFPEDNSVLFWNMGNSLAYEQTSRVARNVQVVKAVDLGRPVGGDVWDGFLSYSRNMDLVGVHRWPLMTGLDLVSYRQWLVQRRRLCHPGTFMWTWVQTHTPDFFTKLLYNQDANQEFEFPVGPQPAQVRLLTYAAVGAGYRGLGYWSDRFLADTHQGRDRLLTVALLNKELEMLEPLLVTIDDPPAWVPTSAAEVNAAVFRTAKGVLVLPMWLGTYAQFVPGQSAATKLEIIVPQVPGGTQAWEVTPGEVRALKTKRVVGGTKVTLPEFGLTSAIVFTSDTNLIVRFQEHARVVRQLAAQWTYEQAIQEIQKVVKVQQELEAMGQAIPQSNNLLSQAQRRLQLAKSHWDNRLFGASYRESQRALRPIRVLMRSQWDRATAKLESPVIIPYGVSYYTLPSFWNMIEEIRLTSPGANVLPGGSFESGSGQALSGWYPQRITLDNVDMKVEVVPNRAKSSLRAKEGTACGMLKIQPKNKEAQIRALERTYLALHSPQVQLQPGSLVQISGWLLIPENIQASVDGVLFYDSIGGEPLSIRLTEKTSGPVQSSANKEEDKKEPEVVVWKKFSLYRRVPSHGSVRVTIAISGIGTVYFDDLRIQPLQSGVRQENTVLRPRNQ